ncbi:hypothetical protein [Mycolicibacterium hodleri]|nr:hypothetical protein [Mycolicibacterium hodleri]
MAYTTALTTLLIVDDDRALSALLSELVAVEGYEVDAAHDAKQ